MQYPEGLGASVDRFRETFVRLAGKGPVVVIVTHGGSITAQQALLTSPSQGEPYTIPYCALSHFSHQNGQFSLLSSLGTAEHLGLGKSEFLQF